MVSSGEPATAESASVRYANLVKKVERLLGQVPSAGEVDETVLGLATCAVEALRDELGLLGGRFYHRFGREFQLQDTFGETKTVEDPPVLPASYGPVDICCAEGLVHFAEDDPHLDRDLEDALGVGEFAAIEVGDAAYLLAFDLAPDLAHDQICRLNPRGFCR